MHFGIIDWAIVIVYVLASGAAGLVLRKYIHSIEDFVVAGRGLNVYIGIATLSATEMGLVTVMYFSEEGYKNGAAVLVLGLISFVTMFVIGLTGFVIKRFRDTGSMTIAEYYEKRYNRGVRCFGGAVIAVAGILNMGVFLRYGAEFLQRISGMPETTMIAGHSFPILNVVMTVLLAVVLAYTMLGGMVSVVFTDYLQFIFLNLGMGVALYCVLKTVNLPTILSTVASAKGIAGMSPFAMPGRGWSWIFWQILVFFAAAALWQASTFRASSARDSKTDRRMYLWSSFTWAGRAIIPILWGIAAFVFFKLHPDKAINVPEEAMMPVFLNTVLPVGLLGLLTAGMLAAFMSTHDSYLLAWSSVITQDVLAPLLGEKRFSTQARIWVTRILIFLIGVFLLIWGLWYQVQGTVWDYLAQTGTMYLSGAMALMVFGLYWRGANSTGATAAILAGIILPAINLFTDKSSVIHIPAGAAGFAAYFCAMISMFFGSLIGKHAKSLGGRVFGVILMFALMAGTGVLLLEFQTNVTSAVSDAWTYIVNTPAARMMVLGALFLIVGAIVGAACTNWKRRVQWIIGLVIAGALTGVCIWADNFATLDAWKVFWQRTFWAVILAYFTVIGVVAIGGVPDLKKLFNLLDTRYKGGEGVPAEPHTPAFAAAPGEVVAAAQDETGDLAPIVASEEEQEDASTDLADSVPPIGTEEPAQETTAKEVGGGVLSEGGIPLTDETEPAASSDTGGVSLSDEEAAGGDSTSPSLDEEADKEEK